MAEQKIDDTKLPAARRGARPFAGPGGASPAASPLLRPIAPGARATQAPFVPAVAARVALGIAPPASRVAPETAPPISSAPASPVADPAPLVESSTPAAAPEPVVPESFLPSEPEPRRRSVTSEMVAVDALDAFETVWSGIDAVDGLTTPTVATSPLAEPSLGGAAEGEFASLHEASVMPDLVLPPVDEIHADEVWRENTNLDEARLASTSSEDSTIDGAEQMPAWFQDATPADADAVWTDVTTIPSADEVLGSDMSMDDTLGSATALHEPLAEAFADEVAPPTMSGDSVSESDRSFMSALTVEEPPAEPWPAPSVAEYMPDVVALETAWEVDVPTPAPSPRELVTDAIANGAPSDIAPAVPGRMTAAGIRVSATLDRLAERVRGGEIDVSTVAPEATDAAVLASVLAALLGGFSRR